MRDFLGNEIKVGDEAVYIDHFKTSSSLKMGKVIDISAFLKCIIVKEAER